MKLASTLRTNVSPSYLRKIEIPEHIIYCTFYKKCTAITIYFLTEIWVTLFYFKVLTVKQCVTHINYCFRFNFTFVLKSLIVVVSYSQLNVWLKILFVVDSQHTAKVIPVIEHSLWDIRELMTITSCLTCIFFSTGYHNIVALFLFSFLLYKSVIWLNDKKNTVLPILISVMLIKWQHRYLQIHRTNSHQIFWWITKYKSVKDQLGKLLSRTCSNSIYSIIKCHVFSEYYPGMV